MSEPLRHKFQNKVEELEIGDFDGPEEYFYALGQFVVYVFEKIGGAHNFRKEFCYLTCPVVHCDAKRLNKRNVHFLGNIDKILKIEDDKINKILALIFDWNLRGKIENINLRMCEVAFYDGIYEENVLLNYEKSSKL
jgi:hypothetical protein